jgi:hypothetical protein
MMTLGPALMLLACFEHARGAFARLLPRSDTFRSSLCGPYLFDPCARRRHRLRRDRHLTRTPAIGLSLPGVYVVWFLALVLLYPICRWFAVLKESGRGWWWSLCDANTPARNSL